MFSCNTIGDTYVRYGSALPARFRELAILTIARGVQYAWNHHTPPALKAGVTDLSLVCGYFIALGCCINAFRVELEADRLVPGAA